MEFVVNIEPKQIWLKKWFNRNVVVGAPDCLHRMSTGWMPFWLKSRLDIIILKSSSHLRQWIHALTLHAIHRVDVNVRKERVKNVKKNGVIKTVNRGSEINKLLSQTQSDEVFFIILWFSLLYSLLLSHFICSMDLHRMQMLLIIASSTKKKPG